MSESSCASAVLCYEQFDILCMKFRCSSGYDLHQYPASMLVSPGVTLGQLNTQVAEQVNALLENVRTQVCIASTRKFDH